MRLIGHRTSPRAADVALTVRRRWAIRYRLAVGVVVTPRGGCRR